MKNQISRRDFIKKSGMIGALAMVPMSFWTGSLFGNTDKEVFELAEISGSDIYQNTLKAINALGGIKRFVKQGQKVGILVNSDFDEKGAYVNPDIALAVIKACTDQGAGEIICIQHIYEKYWQRSVNFESHKSIIEKLNNSTATIFPAKFDEQYFVKKQVNGVGLKEAEIIKTFFDCDVLINVSIAKHHATTIYTGAHKNTMGVCTRETNVTFHLNGPTRNNPEYLAQCIVDLNALRKPDLCIVDATEVLVTNGPSGPGEILTPGKIVAGTDIVATDSLASTLIGHEMGDIITIQKAAELGLGEIDFNKIKIFRE